MTPELQDLISLRFIVMVLASLTGTVLVASFRVARERAAQKREGKPLTTFAEGALDVAYGSAAALSLLLIQDAFKPLPIKAAVGLAMFYGSVGPPLWDWVSALTKGRFPLSKKEAS